MRPLGLLGDIRPRGFRREGGVRAPEGRGALAHCWPYSNRSVHRSRQDQDRGGRSELQLLAVHGLVSVSVTTSTLLAE
jgi:hypothetical protein